MSQTVIFFTSFKILLNLSSLANLCHYLISVFANLQILTKCPPSKIVCCYCMVNILRAFWLVLERSRYFRNDQWHCGLSRTRNYKPEVRSTSKELPLARIIVVFKNGNSLLCTSGSNLKRCLVFKGYIKFWQPWSRYCPVNKRFFFYKNNFIRTTSLKFSHAKNNLLRLGFRCKCNWKFLLKNTTHHIITCSVSLQIFLQLETPSEQRRKSKLCRTCFLKLN